MVDAGRLRGLLDRLAEEVTELRRLAALDQQDLLGNADLLAAVKYRFVIAIETCIDAGEHVIASEGLHPPSTFAEVFKVLGAAGYLSTELATSLRDMARFRNLLIHLYDAVDDQRVVEILHTRLSDFDAFRQEIARSGLEGQ
jgi:uncharacterized protein YutE (UPF0331/DUF86 family)